MGRRLAQGGDRVSEVPNWTTRIETIRRSCTIKGWDSYSAEPVTDETCNLAMEIGTRLPCYDWDAVPTVNGGIEFKFGAMSITVIHDPS